MGRLSPTLRALLEGISAGLLIVAGGHHMRLLYASFDSLRLAFNHDPLVTLGLLIGLPFDKEPLPAWAFQPRNLFFVPV